LDGLSWKTAKRTFDGISKKISGCKYPNVEICIKSISTSNSVSKLLKLTANKDKKIRIQAQKEFAEILAEPLRMKAIS